MTIFTSLFILLQTQVLREAPRGLFTRRLRYSWVERTENIHPTPRENFFSKRLTSDLPRKEYYKVSSRPLGDPTIQESR